MVNHGDNHHDQIRKLTCADMADVIVVAEWQGVNMVQSTETAAAFCVALKI